MKFKALNNFCSFNLFPVFLYLLMIFSASPSLAAVFDEIKQQIQNPVNGRIMVSGIKLGMPEIVSNFYQYNNYQPAWKDKAKVKVLLRQIKDSYNLGLSPEDYLHRELENRLNKTFKSDKEKAQLDILLTDALVRLVYHLKFGKVVPATLDPDWNLRREFTSADQVARLHYALRSKENLQQQLHKISNIGPFYQGLIEALARYRTIESQGGWQPVPAGQSIKPGMSDPRIPLIKARLKITGDLKSADFGTNINNNNTNTNKSINNRLYIPAIEQAVKVFQLRHGLEDDGVIGKNTLVQMNVPVADRINQILANLDRIRWVNNNLGDKFVVVNIAGFQVYYVLDNKVIWHSKTQVGTRYRKTPVFRDEITYIEFNPTWTVPPTILDKDILPKLKKDRAYLKQKNMRIIDHNGKTIDPQSINWATATARTFPYMIRQDPGPGNALGRVKIMFPNKHLVYLHDTPSKSKFNRAERTFSSGCVRVQKPFELVKLLLNNPQKWNQKTFREILDSKETRSVKLQKPVPILLLYFTARMGQHNQVYFFKDVYQRDEKVIKALQQPFQYIKPALARPLKVPLMTQRNS